MTRFILGIGLAMAIGCTAFRACRPVREQDGRLDRSEDEASKDKDDPPPPVTVPAVKPTPPLNLIYPDEVSSENPADFDSQAEE